jgi:hypothetical protein
MAPSTPVDDDQLALVRPVRAGTVLTSDLRRAEWVTPTTMVALAAQAHRARDAGDTFVVRAPIRPDPASYAARMHLGAVLGALGATHDLPDVAERDQRANLVELTAIRTGADADRLAELVFHKLARHDPELASALHRSIGEVGQNVPEHAAAIGYLAAQTMPRRNELLVAVGDAGVGLLHTLAHRGAADHAEAVELAVAPSVSEFDGPTRGAGLPTTLRLIRQVKGSVYIASGDAAVRHRARGAQRLRCDWAYPGTIVEARIPLRARPPERR